MWRNGRRTGLKIRWDSPPVPVRVRPSALSARQMLAQFRFRLDETAVIGESVTELNIVSIPSASSHPASIRESLPVKKGLGSYNEAISPAELKKVRLGWYYNWTPFPKKNSVPDLEFVPMFWSAEYVNPENLALVEGSGAINVLGFNEPDLAGQANMTVEQCLDLWPQLMPLKQRLGSPAPADSVWLEKFMPEARKRGLRIDFICLHRYPDISDTHAVDRIEAWLCDIHQKYGLPIWLTECGAADVKAWHQPELSDPTPELAQTFLKKLLTMLERLAFVERYAWFADRVGDEYSLGSIFEMRANKLTPMGKIYRDAS